MVEARQEEGIDPPVAGRENPVLGVVMDVIYQIVVFLDTLFPAESAIIAVLLAFLPYALLRGPVRPASG